MTTYSISIKLILLSPFTPVLALPNQAPSYFSFSSVWKPPSPPSRSPSQGLPRPRTHGDDISSHSPWRSEHVHVIAGTHCFLIICLCVFSPSRTMRNLRTGCVSCSAQYPQSLHPARARKESAEHSRGLRAAACFWAQPLEGSVEPFHRPERWFPRNAGRKG